MWMECQTTTFLAYGKAHNIPNPKYGVQIAVLVLVTLLI